VARRPLLLLLAALLLVNLGFLLGRDVWTNLFVVNLALGAAALSFPSARRFTLSPARVAWGLAAGLAQVGATKLLLALGPALAAKSAPLYAWQAGHSTAYLLATLPIIVLAEELVWRGVVTRSVKGRRDARVLAGALLFAAAHVASGHALLLAAAVACGAFWGALAEYFDDLTPPFVAHLLWDAALLFVWPAV
jgi:membrane protease YdiL (CAAX protease family)